LHVMLPARTWRVLEEKAVSAPSFLHLSALCLVCSINSSNLGHPSSRDHELRQCRR
jgi:hypothetical protein